jgi:CRISPR/Cas system-associated exonuclease Cas4 (RecB family)
MEAFLAERAAASGDLQFHDAGAPSRATGVPSIGTLLAPLHEDKIAAVEMPPCAPFQTSPSAIEDFLQCPRRYFYARVLNLYDVASSPRQALGHVVHAALRDLKQEGEHASDTGTLLERHWPASGRRFGARLREAAYRRLAEKAVDELRRSEEERAGDGTEFLLAEASFVWSIAPEVELRGTIDRIDRGPEGLIVLDYKLGTHSPTVRATIEKFAPPPASDEGAGWQPSDLQLPLYALAVEQGALADAGIAPGERVAEIGLVYPLLLRTAKGKASEMGRRMIHVVDHAPGCQACDGGSGRGGVGVVCREQLDAVVDRVRATIDEMRGGVIDPLPREGATTCRSCAFRTICPAPQG